MTEVPLYCAGGRALAELAPNGQCPTDGHAGLWYDKFCNQWGAGFSKIPPEGKKAWLDSVAGPRGDMKLIPEYARRQRQLVEGRGELLTATSTAVFVTGMGRDHPMENGFAWHHTLGAPYLPGSGLKGLVRSWAQTWEMIAPVILDELFGPETNTNHRAGRIIFLDVLPLAPVRVQADIMNPHYQPYYQYGDIPGDWHAPNPIIYLVVAPGQTFQFAFLPRTAGVDADTLRQVRHWLASALRWLGAGAKTAIGCGRFEVDPALAEIVEIPYASTSAGASSPAARVPTSARSQVQKSKAAEKAAAYEEKENAFLTWLGEVGFAAGKNRGRQPEIIQQINDLCAPPEKKEKLKRLVFGKLKKHLTIRLKAYLTS